VVTADVLGKKHETCGRLIDDASAGLRLVVPLHDAPPSTVDEECTTVLLTCHTVTHTAGPAHEIATLVAPVAPVARGSLHETPPSLDSCSWIAPPTPRESKRHSPRSMHPIAGLVRPLVLALLIPVPMLSARHPAGATASNRTSAARILPPAPGRAFATSDLL
jgi:hypothetical protein